MTTYTTTIRNKYLTSDADSIDDMIKCHKNQIAYLEKLKNIPNLEVDFASAQDDYIFASTSDEKIAKEFGMLENEEDEIDV